MKLTVEINNRTKNRLDKKFVSEVVSQTLKSSKLDFLLDKKVSVSLAIVGKGEIKKLNKVYRKKDCVTDILSFSEFKNIRELKKNKGNAVFLGELVLCYDDIKEYAKKNGLNLQEELARVVSHGILHLLGLHHGKKMFYIQNKAARKIS